MSNRGSKKHYFNFDSTHNTNYETKKIKPLTRKDLEELKEFSEWCSNSNGDVVLEDKLHTREKELSMAVTSLSAENRAKDKELRRKDKALAEAAALLVLSKKAQAIWGDKDE